MISPDPSTKPKIRGMTAKKLLSSDKDVDPAAFSAHTLEKTKYSDAANNSNTHKPKKIVSQDERLLWFINAL